MTISLARPPDNPRGVADQPACACPTTTVPGTLVDQVNTRHRPSCRVLRTLGLGAGQALTTIRYAAGTLDRLLDERFGPVTR